MCARRTFERKCSLIFLYKKRKVWCVTDWPSQRTLLDVYVAISGSRVMYETFEEMRTLRTRNLQETEQERILRSAFLKTNGPAFRMWLLQSSHFTHGAKRQLMWHTFQAKFYGLSRMGIRSLSNFGLLCPLTSLDRHWKKLISNYQQTTRFQTPLKVRVMATFFLYKKKRRDL